MLSMTTWDHGFSWTRVHYYILQKFLPGDGDDFEVSYCYLQYVQENQYGVKKKSDIFLFWCFSPGLKPEQVKMVAAGRNHTIVSTGQ